MNRDTSLAAAHQIAVGRSHDFAVEFAKDHISNMPPETTVDCKLEAFYGAYGKAYLYYIKKGGMPNVPDGQD